ncbi:uncharacterized protein PFLUO_LOCUS7927 [Penicillium psychrofluorescens]|uniref:uncharacterized protein n=1 Tax=Penicillium psychrofluorescens TaxID=3158075 RepID=UPI003CCDDE29
MPPKRGQRLKLGMPRSADNKTQRKSLPSTLAPASNETNHHPAGATPKRGRARKSMPGRVNGVATPEEKKDSPRNSNLTPRGRGRGRGGRGRGRGRGRGSSLSTPAASARRDGRPTRTPRTKSSPDHHYTHDYDVESPSSDESSRSSTPEVPSTRRRGFQSRPSRLSNVFTPTVDTPSTNQGSRRTRRMTTLKTPKNQMSDQEVPDTMDASPWTYDDYMSEFGFDGAMDPPDPPASLSASSANTRTSVRVRKPTLRAMEALESQKKRRTRRGPTLAAEGEVPPEEPPRRTISGRPTKNSTKPEYTPTAKGPKRGRGLKPKTALRRLEIDTAVAGRKMYDLVVFSLGTEYRYPDNPKQFLADRRKEFEDLQAKKDSGGEVGEAAPKEKDVVMTDADVNININSHERTVLGFSKKSSPVIEADGWVKTGRVNPSGEEFVIMPRNHSPFRSPRDYGDESLPGRLRSQPKDQFDTDEVFGYPPRVGDRNKPADLDSKFTQENIAEEKSKMKTRGSNRKPKPLESVENNKISSSRKRRHNKLKGKDDHDEPTPATPSTTNGGSAPKRKRRRHTEPVPTAAKGSSASKATKGTTAKSIAKGTKTAPTTPSATEETEKPKIQRLRLTLKPSSEGLSYTPTTKGKKRGADAIADDDKESDTSPKRQRVTFKAGQAAAPKGNSHTPAKTPTKTKKQDAGAEKQEKPKAVSPKPVPKGASKGRPSGATPARRGGRQAK